MHKKLRELFYSDDPNWLVLQGSVLDSEFIDSLRDFDIVYSWGVLHHTANLWSAVDKVANLVGESGRLYIALYNYQNWISDYWSFVKRTYNKFPIVRPFWILIHFIYPVLPSIVIKLFANKRPPRGMTFWYDLLDWLGGLPFEVSTPDQIFEFLSNKGFKLQKLKTVRGKMGCNEFVFSKF